MTDLASSPWAGVLPGLGVSQIDGGPDDPFWKTERGAALFEELNGANRARAASEAEALAAAAADLAAQQAKDRAQRQAEQDAAHVAWRAQQEADQAAAAARAKTEADAYQALCAAQLAERTASAAAAKTANDALILQDADFHAFRIDIEFFIDGIDDLDAPVSDVPVDGWASNDDLAAALSIGAAIPHIRDAVAPWFVHFGAIGLIRADGLDGEFLGELAGTDLAPAFYLVCRAESSDLDPAALADFAASRLALEALPGTELVISGTARPVNATLLHRAVTAAGATAGQWRGEETSDLAPLPNEERDCWLSRVMLSPTAIERALDRHQRSGGDIELFGLFGSADERASGSVDVECIIPGLFPKGFTSVVVGPGGSGKSTLMGEVAAAIDSQNSGPRWALGVQVETRGVCAVVTGEDGDLFVNQRAEFYEPVHGPARGMVIDARFHPWTKTLRLLRRVPELCLVVLDPMRAMLTGDEDSSTVINAFFQDVNALALEKNCAVVVVHHLSKGACRAFPQMLQMVRGSAVITQRPRQVLGLLPRGAGVTDIALIKNNITTGQPVWGELNVGRAFRQDKATLTLVPVGQAGQAGDERAGQRDIRSAILAALAHHSLAGTVLRRTGKSDLYQRKLPQFAGVSRTAMLEAMAALIEAGTVQDTPDGLQLADPQITNGGIA